jgi:hypothetical protein
MSSSKLRGGGDVTVEDEAKVRVLTLGGVAIEEAPVKLRDYGYVGYVTEEAREEIVRNELRASRVVTTAAKFAFRSPG